MKWNSNLRHPLLCFIVYQLTLTAAPCRPLHDSVACERGVRGDLGVCATKPGAQTVQPREYDGERLFPWDHRPFAAAIREADGWASALAKRVPALRTGDKRSSRAAAADRRARGEPARLPATTERGGAMPIVGGVRCRDKSGPTNAHAKEPCHLRRSWETPHHVRVRRPAPLAWGIYIYRLAS